MKNQADKDKTQDFPIFDAVPEFDMIDLKDFDISEFPPSMIAEMEAAGKSLNQSLKQFSPQQEETDDE